MKSMTGYGKAVFSNENYEIEIEIKSLNNRFQDMKIALPRELNPFEQEIRTIVGNQIRRGKIEIRIETQNKLAPKFFLNENRIIALRQLYQDAQRILDLRQDIPLDKILEDKFAIKEKTGDIDDDFKKYIIETLTSALERHQQSALIEGASMKESLEESLKTMLQSLEAIEIAFEDYREKLKDKFSQTLIDFKKELPTDEIIKRISLEIAMYVDRSAINEEIVRLKTHYEQFDKYIGEQNKAVGKNLNFILQEMHREINTIGSKFNTAESFVHILSIKEEVEKCREMIQNVE